MGLPYLILTDSGATTWRAILVTAGFEVELDTEEIQRLEQNGEHCEPENHPRVVSMFPYRVRRHGVILRCLEVKQRDNVASLTFVAENEMQRDLLDQFGRL